MTVIGFSHVAPKYYDQSLTGGVAAGGASGYSAVKTYLSPGYATDYPTQNWGSTPTSLVELASTAPYVTVFSNPDIQHHFCNTWSFANGLTNPWTVNVTVGQLENEYNEVRALAEHFLANYPGKTLTIQNWEGDWSLIGAFDATLPVPPGRSQRMRAFSRARQEAVRDARRGNASTAQVFHALELNRGLDNNTDRVHRDVSPFVEPDRMSLSLYEAINTLGSSTAEAVQNIRVLMPRLVNDVRRKMRLHNTPIYIGEFGWNEDEAPFTTTHNVADLLNEVIDQAYALGLIAALHWNWADNEEQSPGVERGFKLINRDGSLSNQGTALLARL